MDVEGHSLTIGALNLEEHRPNHLKLDSKKRRKFRKNQFIDAQVRIIKRQ
jgi:hypothetical protein